MNIVKKLYHNTILGRFLMAQYHFYKTRLLPEKYYAKNLYRKTFGVYPDLKKPKTLNEKITWLKLFDRTELHTICADKYEVRNYVKSKIGEEYLVPLFFVTDKPMEITTEITPKEPFVIKTNHDSGGVYLIKNINEVNFSEIKQDLAKRIKRNYYWKSKEWQYKNITPKIIIEKMLCDVNGKIPKDYKIHCFNGKTKMIQVDVGRGTKNHYRNWYSPSWEREPYKWSSPKGNGIFTDPSEIDIDPPKKLEEMIRLSEILAQPFYYVRIDWYELEEKLYFGEITFHHDSGRQKIIPEEWDFILGSKLIIPTDGK